MTLEQIEARRLRDAALVAWTKAAGVYDIWTDAFIGRTKEVQGAV